MQRALNALEPKLTVPMCRSLQPASLERSLARSQPFSLDLGRQPSSAAQTPALNPFSAAAVAAGPASGQLVRSRLGSIAPIGFSRAALFKRSLPATAGGHDSAGEGQRPRAAASWPTDADNAPGLSLQPAGLEASKRLASIAPIGFTRAALFKAPQPEAAVEEAEEQAGTASLPEAPQPFSRAMFQAARA